MAKRKEEIQQNEFELDFNLYNDVKDILTPVKSYKKKGIEYLNVASSFDIETSSYYEGDVKRACMYMWGLGINGKVIIKRTYEEFVQCLNDIIEYYNLSFERRLIIYVHNLAYEMQFIRKWLEWEKVFAIDERKPVYCITKQGIEFRCSYILSGYSLDTLGKNLIDYPVKKLVGNLDYSLIRTTKTKISKQEFDYLINDNLVVMSYIQELINRLGNITRIQITKTAFVRKLCKDNLFYDNGSHHKNGWKFKAYRKYMNNLIITSPQEYEQMKRAFQGGYTHGSCLAVGRIFENVASYDFTSSYPYVMCAYAEYPITTGKVVKIHNRDELEKYLKCYCCIFDVEFENLESKILFEHYISVSKCKCEGQLIEDNGRLVFGEKVRTTITHIDFEVIRKVYEWKKIKIFNFRIYKKGYLPKDLILTILDLYGKKTTLKGVAEKLQEYQVSKEQVNSVYGMMVTDIVRTLFEYDNDIDEWTTSEPNIKDMLSKYNGSFNRFNFYGWGLIVTALARRNIWTGIYTTGKNGDYLYSDTDSLKITNYLRYEKYINDYNKLVEYNLKTMCEHYNIDFKLCKPKTIKGKEKLLGVYDFEGVYTKFKTLGAKRYMTFKDDVLSYTIAGCGKIKGVPYLLNTFGIDFIVDEKSKECHVLNNFDKIDDIFNFFNEGFTIPREHTGKQTHTYIDDEFTGFVTDYQGHKTKVHERSYIHLEQCEFSLTMASKFKEYLTRFRLDLR